MDRNRLVFLAFSEAVTGYSSLELEGTGLVDDYQGLLDGALGEEISIQFYSVAREITEIADPQERQKKIAEEVVSSPVLWPIVSNLISLWYLGTWTVLPDSWYVATGGTKPGVGEPGSSKVPPSSRAYIEQLSYRTAGAHTPGAKPTGFGGWSLPPVF